MMLEDANHFFTTLAKICPVGIYRTDANGNWNYINECGCEITGLKQESVLGIGWQRALHPDDFAKVAQAWNTAVRSHLSFIMEYRFLNQDGETRWVLGRATSERDAMGNMVGYVGTITDITEHKRTLSALQKKESQLRQAQSIAHIGSWDHDLVTGQLTWTDELYRIFGVSPDTFTPNIENFIDLIHPDDQPAMQAWIQSCISGDKPGSLEFRCVWPDGTIHHIEGQGELFLDAYGKPIQISGTGQNITERKKAQEHNEEKLRALQLLGVIADSSNDAIFAKDVEGRYLLCNREMLRQSGKSLAKVINNKDEDVFSPEDAALIKERDHSVLKWRQPTTFEEILNTVDGERIFLTTKGPLRDASGNLLGIFGISRDITESKQAEETLKESMRQLEEKELAKTRFLAAASHDMRQPLAAANLFIDALKLSQQTPQQSDIIKHLDQSMSTFNELLDALLNVSKLDSGIIKPELTSINVVEVFNWLEQNYLPLASQKQIGFRLYFPMKERLVVKGDIGLLNSVLMNLVSNAIKFTSEGAILISARRRGSEILFQVWDSGIGIDDENIKYIFDEFYQINNAQRDRTRGLGLGLSIAQRAIALLGGKISCRSMIGRGSVFEFSLPLDRTSSKASLHTVTAVSQKAAIDESFGHGKKFVVVEDDQLVAQAMRDLLKNMGGNVKCFNKADDALLEIDHEHADYFIVDYMLAGQLNGIQFLNRLRQRLGKPIKAVLITGDTSASFIRHAVEFNWPVLHKPINATKLIASLSFQE